MEVGGAVAIIRCGLHNYLDWRQSRPALPAGVRSNDMELSGACFPRDISRHPLDDGVYAKSACPDLHALPSTSTTGKSSNEEAVGSASALSEALHGSVSATL